MMYDKAKAELGLHSVNTELQIYLLKSRPFLQFRKKEAYYYVQKNNYILIFNAPLYLKSVQCSIRFTGIQLQILQWYKFTLSSTGMGRVFFYQLWGYWRWEYFLFSKPVPNKGKRTGAFLWGTFCICTIIGSFRVLKEIDSSPPYFNINSKVMPNSVNRKEK